MNISRLILILSLAASLMAADTSSIEFSQLSPEPQHKKVSSLIVKYVDNFHYQKKALDDSMSVEVFERFFDKLDPTRIYFLASDIVHFDKYRYMLDD